jgi:ABC-2 type transport system permease protein
LLSGSNTPMESMPTWLQYLMRTISPTPHFVAFAQAVLYRGAGLAVIWSDLLAVVAIGSVYFMLSLRRFRRVIFES